MPWVSDVQVFHVILMFEVVSMGLAFPHVHFSSRGDFIVHVPISFSYSYNPWSFGGSVFKFLQEVSYPGIACLLISCSFYRRFQILVSSLMVWITACLWAILLFLILFSFTFGCPSGFYSPWHFLSKIFPSLLFTTVLSLSDSSFISNYIFIRNQK